MISAQKISLNTKVTQNRGNIASDMDGEKVLMSINNSKYYNLGKLGGVIWDLIEDPIQVTNVIAALLADYEVSQKECEEHVISFLEGLHREGLIEV